MAVAANVPVHADDQVVSGIPDASGLPYALLGLPPDGTVLVATFVRRGDHAFFDASFPARGLPLPIADAEAGIRLSAQVRPEEPLGQYELLAAVNGFNVDLSVYFGRQRPTRAQLAETQRQLDRLVVAPGRRAVAPRASRKPSSAGGARQRGLERAASGGVTLVARPTTLGAYQRAMILGVVDNGREGEPVTLEVKACGQRSFTGVQVATTLAGGRYSTEYDPVGMATVRAVWKGATSAEVTLRQQARVSLSRLASGKYSASITSRTSFWHKQVQVQRRQGASWKTVKTVILSESDALPSVPYVWTAVRFALNVPKGSVLRAVLPLPQAKPCYLAGVSRSLRT